MSKIAATMIAVVMLGGAAQAQHYEATQQYQFGPGGVLTDQQYQIELQREQLARQSEEMARQRAAFEEELAHQRAVTYLDPYGTDR